MRQRAENPGIPSPAAAGADRRRTDLAILWGVNAVDGLGSQASGVVFPLLLLGLGHSPGTAGTLAGSVALAGVVLGPLVAVPADRGRRRRIMTGSAALAALGTGLLALVCLGRPALWVVVSLALLERLCSAAYEAASRGALVRLADVDALPRAAAGLQVGDQASLVLGPALGGALFQLARPLPFLADAISYAAAAVGVGAIRTPLDTPLHAPLDATLGRPLDAPRDTGPEAGHGVARRARAGAALRGWTGAVRAGLGTVAGSPVLRLVLVWTSAAGGTLTLLFYTALFELGRDTHAAATGLVLAASGAAGLVGALVAPAVVRRSGAARVLTAAAWTLPVPCGALWWAGGAWGWGAAFAGLSLVLPLITVVLSSVAVACTPVPLQSRVGSVLGSAAALTAAGAPAAAGLLVTVWSTRAPVLLCTALFAVLALYTQVRAHAVVRAAKAAGAAGAVPGPGGGDE
ncbi:MFS transporter [Streptomyces anandii]|uniref:MFS transporter n=1 Tax=Streptomyces anandii TaxID=285454 RepID=UPI001679AA00|nr:MFS transporter [Streptomyces anandii]